MTPITVRANDASGDWTWGRGKNDYLTRNNAIGQNIQTRLLSFLGDCFFKVTDGIDWFTFLGSKGAQNQTALNLAVNATILNTEGVVSLVQSALSIDSARKITISYTVTTIYTGVLGPTATVNGVTNFLITEGGSVITTEDGNPITT